MCLNGCCGVQLSSTGVGWIFWPMVSVDKTWTPEPGVPKGPRAFGTCLFWACSRGYAWNPGRVRDDAEYFDREGLASAGLICGLSSTRFAPRAVPAVFSKAGQTLSRAARELEGSAMIGRPQVQACSGTVRVREGAYRCESWNRRRRNTFARWGGRRHVWLPEAKTTEFRWPVHQESLW